MASSRNAVQGKNISSKWWVSKHTHTHFTGKNLNQMSEYFLNKSCELYKHVQSMWQVHLSWSKQGGFFFERSEKKIYTTKAITLIQLHIAIFKLGKQEVVIFYTEILTGKVVLWVFLRVKREKKSTIQLFKSKSQYRT